MIWSVSMFDDGMTAVRERKVLNRFHQCSTVHQFAWIRKHDRERHSPAAVSGLASNVRAPMPWRPSKLRLLVLTEYWPLETRSPFMPRHIEHPDSRHSAPGVDEHSVQPLGLGVSLNLLRPGDHEHLHALGNLVSAKQAGGATQVRQSPIRALPTNTTVTIWVLDRRSSFQPHVASDLANTASPVLIGIAPEIGTTMPGCVP